MSDLAAFLSARLDEDRATALVATSCSEGAPHDSLAWHVKDGEITEIVGDDGTPDGIKVARAHQEDPGVLAHIARHDPARVLAEVEAKRQILDLHRDGGYSQGYTNDAEYYGGFEHACAQCGYHGEYGVPWPCLTLRLLVVPYAGHPDYQEGWRP